MCERTSLGHGKVGTKVSGSEIGGSGAQALSNEGRWAELLPKFVQSEEAAVSLPGADVSDPQGGCSKMAEKACWSSGSFVYLGVRVEEPNWMAVESESFTVTGVWLVQWGSIAMGTFVPYAGLPECLQREKKCGVLAGSVKVYCLNCCPAVNRLLCGLEHGILLESR